MKFFESLRKKSFDDSHHFRLLVQDARFENRKKKGEYYKIIKTEVQRLNCQIAWHTSVDIKFWKRIFANVTIATRENREKNRAALDMDDSERMRRENGRGRREMNELET